MLDTTKLETKLKEYGVEPPELHKAYKACSQRMKASMVRQPRKVMESGVMAQASWRA
jgi:hypothetical protein